MNKSIALFNKGFESSSSTTPEFSKFYNTFKKEFSKELECIGATKIEFHKGHFYLSGFYTIDSQSYYFNISDVRFFKPFQLLYRTCKDYKDYTGDSNNYLTVKSLMTADLLKYHKRLSKAS